MSTLKHRLNETVTSIVELLVGILLLINPVVFTSSIIVIFGVILMICGIVNIVKYFREEPEDAAVKQLLAKGLAELLAGAFCAVHSHWFVVTFPILTLIYGVVILFAGLTKIQWTADMVRLKRKRWIFVLLSAVISVICGIVIISSPFSSTAVLWMFTGISLIVEAVFDIVAAIWGNKEPQNGAAK